VAPGHARGHGRADRHRPQRLNAGAAKRAWTGLFAVTAYSRSRHDRLTGGSFSCRNDFATGNWEFEATGRDAGPGEATVPVSETGRTAPARLPLAGWRAFAPLPGACGEANGRHVAARE
jgi:hypothetical protein